MSSSHSYTPGESSRQADQRLAITAGSSWFALRNLVQKDFCVRYRNMALGMAWSIINPLVMLGVILLVFTMVYPSTNRAYFPVFLLIGLIGFNVAAMILPPATTSIVDHALLIKKLAFPRLLLPLSVVCSQFIHLAIQVIILLFFVLIFRIPLQLTWFWILPVFLVLATYILGLSCFLAALQVVYRDTLYVVESAIKVLFWLSPVFYSVDQVQAAAPDWVYMLFILNPLAGCIDALRAAVLEGRHPSWDSLGVATLVAVTVCIAGGSFFRARQHHFADYL